MTSVLHLAAVIPADPLSLLLVVAVMVLCVTTVAMVVGAGSADRARRSRTAPRLGAIPVVPMITPPRTAPRPRPVEARIGATIADLPARQTAETGDDRAGSAARVEAAHALVDRLAATDPQRLAEIITQWMHQDDPTT